MLRIELNTVRVDSNKSEWTRMQKASIVLPCGTGFTTIGFGQVVREVCKKALEYNPVLGQEMVEVYRGSTLVFHPSNMASLASGTAFNTREQPAQLKRGKP